MGHHRRTGIPVAIKRGTLDTTYLGTVTRRVYKNELQLLGIKLANSCPNIPLVMDWFEDDRNVFLVLSFIKGSSLKCVGRDYTESQILTILRKLLEILGNIHKHGIIYKDIKPGNVIEDEYGTLFLIDFNIAREIENQSDNEEAIGTPGYCPPEQLLTGKTEHTDFSSDIYALGRLIENLLLQDKFDRSGHRTPLRAYRRDISVELESIVLKMTEPDKKNRFQSVEDVLQALENYQMTGPVKKIMMHFISERRIRAYFAEIQQIDQKRKEHLQEMADMTEISRVFEADSKGEEADHTVFL